MTLLERLLTTLKRRQNAMNLLATYILDSLEDLTGQMIEPSSPVQILTGYPDYVRLTIFGTDMFDTTKVFANDGRKTFGLSAINYRITVFDFDESYTTNEQKYRHPFDNGPVLFQDGIMRFRHDCPMLKLFSELPGMPDLMTGAKYCQFIN